MPHEGSSLYYALLGLMQTTTSVVVLIFEKKKNHEWRKSSRKEYKSSIRGQDEYTEERKERVT